MIQDKFSMEQQDNIFYAKRNIVDSIYSQSKLEGIAVTFPDTQEIYEGRSVAGLSVEDIVKVNNLKHGWEFLFDTVGYPLDLRYVRQLNKEIGAGIVTNAGDLRNSDVSIGGTSWKPEIPIYEKIEAEIQAACSQSDHDSRRCRCSPYSGRVSEGIFCKADWIL